MKQQYLAILQSDISDKAKFSQLLPIYRNHPDPNEEMRKAINLGYTDFRFKAMQNHLNSVFQVSAGAPPKTPEGGQGTGSSYDKLTKKQLNEEIAKRPNIKDHDPKAKNDDLIALLVADDMQSKVPTPEEGVDTQGGDDDAEKKS